MLLKGFSPAGPSMVGIELHTPSPAQPVGPHRPASPPGGTRWATGFVRLVVGDEKVRSLTVLEEI